MVSTGLIVDMDNFGNGGRQLRLRCSHTRLFCTRFWRPWFRASRQPKNLEADRVQPVSTLPKPPTRTAEERVMCGSHLPDMVAIRLVKWVQAAPASWQGALGTPLS